MWGEILDLVSRILFDDDDDRRWIQEESHSTESKKSKIISIQQISHKPTSLHRKGCATCGTGWFS